MHKFLVFLKRRPELSPAVFFDWWLGANSTLTTRIPGLRRYTVSLEADGEDGAFDGLAEMWFDNVEGAGRGFGSVEGRAAVADIDLHALRVERLQVEEHRFVDVALPAPCKLIAALKRRVDLSHGQFKSWWLERHAPLVVGFPELRRYQVNIVSEDAQAFVDGVAEVAYADLDTVKRISSSPQVRAVQGDSQVHTSARYRMYVAEHPIIR